jgi:hypothetical protein
MSRPASLVLAFSALALVAGTAAAQSGKEPGVYWEQTVAGEMAGFQMPPQTSKICMPTRQWEEPPRSKDDKCKMTDVKRSGSRMSWKLACEGGVTGEGEMNTTKDAYQGTMSMRTPGGDMRMKMSGKKLGGDCDASAMKPKR